MLCIVDYYCAVPCIILWSIIRARKGPFLIRCQCASEVCEKWCNETPDVTLQK